MAISDWLQWDHFGESCGALVEVLDEPTEVVERLVHASAQCDAMAARALGECVLQPAEEVPRAGQRDGH